MSDAEKFLAFALYEWCPRTNSATTRQEHRNMMLVHRFRDGELCCVAAEADL